MNLPWLLSYAYLAPTDHMPTRRRRLQLSPCPISPQTPVLSHVFRGCSCCCVLQEARGLDAGPRLVERLVGAGDSRSAAVVKQICDEEMAHVAVGVAWFSFVCARLGVEPYEAFSCKPKGVGMG